jgi:type I restriction enzyme S subunit
VRGKLVPQDPKDGTGRDLLSSLKRARSQWEAAGRIRKEKGGAAVVDEEKYLELPGTWTWARLKELGQTQTGTSPSSANPDLFGNFIPFVKPADLDGNEVNYHGPGLSEAGVGHSRLVPAYSVLMVCIGATLGKVNKTTRPVCFNQQINSLTPFLDGPTDYVALALRASGFQALARSKAGTGTLPIISKGKWEILPIPLSPSRPSPNSAALSGR